MGHIAFLRQAASELRDAAFHELQKTEALRPIADQIKAKADDLAEATGLRGRRWSRSQKLSQSTAKEVAEAAASSRSVYACAIVIADGPFCNRHADERTDPKCRG
jgi:hypothetical protein